MNNKTHETNEKIELALNGDKQALESLLGSVQNMVYNLSLRMLGSPHDAEDATQEILIKIMTSLSSFRKESEYSTWVYRIATNFLLNYKKSFFAKQPPLSFDFYGADIEAGFLKNNPGMMIGVDEEILTHELKMSCTNVMLQCFDPESRLIYVLGIMFRVESKVCGEILGITPEAYRQRLSRIRQRMADFMKQYCGLASSEKCNCQRRVGYAITNRRLNPANLEYHQLEKVDQVVALDYLEAMEEMDAESAIFAKLPRYCSPKNTKDFLQKILMSANMATIMAPA